VGVVQTELGDDGRCLEYIHVLEYFPHPPDIIGKNRRPNISNPQLQDPRDRLMKCVLAKVTIFSGPTAMDRVVVNVAMPWYYPHYCEITRQMTLGSAVSKGENIPDSNDNAQ
jgi:hypothetical protein